MPDLFPSAPHDPGGKVRLRMLPGCTGGATFSPCSRYRTTLHRSWGRDGDCAPYALWIGMNPSTADADVDDPTIRRELGFTRTLGLSCYVKVNVSDYRCTDPKRLPQDDTLRSPDNLATIMQKAHAASRVIAAWGTLKGRLQQYAAETAALLAQHDIPLWCLGTTADGSPRHPSRIANRTELVRWNGWPNG